MKPAKSAADKNARVDLASMPYRAPAQSQSQGQGQRLDPGIGFLEQRGSVKFIKAGGGQGQRITAAPVPSVPKPSEKSWWSDDASADASVGRHHRGRDRDRDNTYVYYVNDYNAYNPYVWPPYYGGPGYGPPGYGYGPGPVDPSFADSSMVYKCMWDYDSNPGMCNAVLGRQASARFYNPSWWFW